MGPQNVHRLLEYRLGIEAYVRSQKLRRRTEGADYELFFRIKGIVQIEENGSKFRPAIEHSEIYQRAESQFRPMDPGRWPLRKDPQ